jgi:hypothetical protein
MGDFWLIQISYISRNLKFLNAWMLGLPMPAGMSLGMGDEK